MEECKIRNYKWGTCNCSQITANTALKLINRLQANNEEKEDVIQYANKEIKRLNAENESLKSSNNEKFRQWDMLAEKTKQHYSDLYNEAKDRLKAEAYKEFAERLNEKAQIADCFDSYNMVVGTHFIDNLLKEMVGEERMRETEILFRGEGNKKYNDGGWYYGVPIQCSDGDWQICTNCSKRTVIAKTIGQYTGLTDKNGKKIFEGDILKANNGHSGWVIFRNGSFVKRCYCHPKSFNAIFGDNETVIGNIYDNLKLLGSDIE